MDIMQSPEKAKQYKKDLQGCRGNNDSPRMASFISPSLGLRMTLLESLERVDPGKPGGISRVLGTGFNIQFKAGEYHTWNLTQIRLIMTSTDYKAGKIIINPEDPGGFWEDQGMLKTKMIEVVDKAEQGYVDFKDIDLDKISAPVVLTEEQKKKQEKKGPRMIVG